MRLAFKSWSSIDIVELHIVEKINETLAGGKLGNLAPPGWDADSLLCDYTKVQSEEDVCVAVSSTQCAVPSTLCWCVAQYVNWWTHTESLSYSEP